MSKYALLSCVLLFFVSFSAAAEETAPVACAAGEINLPDNHLVRAINRHLVKEVRRRNDDELDRALTFVSEAMRNNSTLIQQEAWKDLADKYWATAAAYDALSRAYLAVRYPVRSSTVQCTPVTVLADLNKVMALLNVYRNTQEAYHKVALRLYAEHQSES